MGPARVVCARWGQVHGAQFQLHEPKLTAPYSSSSPAPGHLQLPGKCWVCLEKAGGEPRMGTPPGYLTGALLEHGGGPFPPGSCLPTSALALAAQGGQHCQVVSHMGERCQFCSLLSSTGILKQTVTKQVNLTPLAWQLCPWQPGSWEESTEDRFSTCNHQVKQSQVGLLYLFCERSLSFQA